MVELVDTRDLKSLALTCVPVRARLAAPNQYNPNQVFPVGDGFGLFVFFGKFEETHFRNDVVKRPESKPGGPEKKKQIREFTHFESRFGTSAGIDQNCGQQALLSLFVLSMRERERASCSGSFFLLLKCDIVKKQCTLCETFPANLRVYR